FIKFNIIQFIRFLKFLKLNWLHLLKAFFSGIFWGLGQAFNKQFLKAIFFFTFFILLIGIEFGTSKYNEEVNPMDLIKGKEFAPTLAEKFHGKYQLNVISEITEPIDYYDTFYTEAKADGEFANQELFAFLIEDLSKQDINAKTKGYFPTPLSIEFQSYMEDFYDRPGNTYTPEDYTKFLIDLHFMQHPEVKEEFLDRYNFYHDKGGFFVKGIWSILTLGEVDPFTINDHMLFYELIPPSQSNLVLTNVPFIGHQSVFLLLKGIISTIFLLYFLVIMAWSMSDAYKTSKLTKTGHKVPSQTKYFKEAYEHSFEYIVLFPAILVISLVSIMPIIYGMMVAFTNYTAKNPHIIDWVGFDNFKNIIKFADSDVPFGKVFPRVFGWTFVWAIFSTATVFFAGFFQAVILNNSRVVFRKLWRTFLILPWAVPALISQMIFKLMFNEKGIVNEFLKKIGAYAKFNEWGLLGRESSSIHGFWETITFLGNSDIQWFFNPVNSTFVRATIIIINIWLGFPFFMALMTGVMTSIDKTLYEAADIDGATSKSKFKYITFPLVMASTAPLLLMTFSGNFNNFGVIYFITEGGFGAGDFQNAFAGQTDILISWMYRLTVDKKLYNMASVFSIIIFLIIGSLSAWNFTRMKAFKED
ncbi:MAG: hypothetical protein K0Q49_2241, partial [Haloplasmataceae bacterium]|nr:hypothetical protein [Haloplasmataceae bacterium]